MRLDFRLQAPREPTRVWLFWALMVFASAATAQSPVNHEPQSSPAAQGQEHPQKKPTLPAQLEYTSPLHTYQGYKEQPVQPWREANDRVGQIGGWRTYAKEAQAAAPGQNTPNDPHAGHQSGGKP